MAVGLPIVNTALATGVPKVARHGHEAITVPPNDPHALATAIRGLLDDTTLATRLGRAGSLRAQTEYEQAHFVAQMKRIYIETHARRSRDRPPGAGEIGPASGLAPESDQCE